MISRIKNQKWVYQNHQEDADAKRHELIEIAIHRRDGRSAELPFTEMPIDICTQPHNQ